MYDTIDLQSQEENSSGGPLKDAQMEDYTNNPMSEEDHSDHMTGE